MNNFNKFLKETKIGDEGQQYAVVLKGGSIGEKTIRGVRDLKGNKVSDYEKLYDDIIDAKANAKDRNKRLSLGEKKYYGLIYIVAKVKDGVFTGK